VTAADHRSAGGSAQTDPDELFRRIAHIAPPSIGLRGGVM
jgi:hypothetical protein